MKKIAYFDTSHDMPEEIISAAGFIPYRILGQVHEPAGPADQYLPEYSCPFACSCLTEVLQASDSWAGIVFANGCDTTSRHFEIWKLHVNTPFIHWFNSPVEDGQSAVKFFVEELRRLIAHIEECYSQEISTTTLRRAISDANEVKFLLGRLSSYRAVKDISNREYFEAVKKALQGSKSQVIRELREMVAAWAYRPVFPEGKKRFLLTGSDVTYGEWMDFLDECGIRVVRDDLSLGERYFARLIPENADPLEALASYYLSIPRPAAKTSIARRVDYLLQAVRQTPVDGVISQNLKFCEPYAQESVTVNRALKDQGLKLIHLEREYTAAPDQQAVDKLHAFIETL
ncbi:MAG: 2-hydroxyacyl-CoA dehydratase subunit D [Desulfomonilia bacterium]|jgi:benzoyl-CoA reductase/2-hydroxyglutaryl-CoA dehydratase subunit BcrC/BadD/HgdB|uniref:R-phenyllactate dehydratase beta subunit n=1 Tax=anaerobic digester metagenome TaxID=1263854 RepID=A0A485M6K5_9ZZZZ|nr:2-hydroxyacyl-CoA dehydratase family protein [Pseudomonadota bacterium]HON38811.1 2-hydroxyacyl-CoA dehydratase family protein [Deltaproteobacteria bacterium]HRS56763.1 2-hydroxyacyl-CoA dehydratase family protein [Desulfomonilia bacterium]HPD21769.1 2-hydroxyacyl-CoA dehydratase family protein [Deltaproteobacteria bacterium]HPX18673.1 2-hydroxyacyl-CoA dehydratase family protein [Deltaproteobacteria bacterium]